MGIECIYVSNGGHAWNVIKLEGDYYHLDTTWGDLSNTDQSKDGGNGIYYDCFCITTEEVGRLDSHQLPDTLPLPECTATSCNYHRRNGLYFDKYDLGAIRNIVLENVSEDVLDNSFKFSSSDVLDEVKRELIDNGKMHEIIQYVNLKSKTKVKSEYKYSVKDERLIIFFSLINQ